MLKSLQRLSVSSSEGESGCCNHNFPSAAQTYFILVPKSCTGMTSISEIKPENKSITIKQQGSMFLVANCRNIFREQTLEIHEMVISRSKTHNPAALRTFLTQVTTLAIAFKQRKCAQKQMEKNHTRHMTSRINLLGRVISVTDTQLQVSSPQCHYFLK